MNLLKTVSVVALFTILGKLLGVVREVVLAALYGASANMDSFIVAGMLTLAIGGILQAGVNIAFIPIYTDLTLKDSDKANQFANNVFCLVFLTSLFIAAIVYMEADFFVDFFTPGFTEETKKLTVELTKIMVPVLPLMGLIGLMCAIQQAHKRFLDTAAAAMVFNLAVIAVILETAKEQGIYAAALATNWATFIQLLFQMFSAWRCGFHFAIKIKGLDKKNTIHLTNIIAPVFVGAAATQTCFAITRMAASSLPEGSITALSYAYRIDEMILNLFVSSLATVIFPYLAQDSSTKNIKSFHQTLDKSIKIVLFILCPSSIFLAIFSEPFTTLLFYRGQFDLLDVSYTATALLCYAPLLITMALLEIFNRAFYANKNTKIPTILAVCSVLLNAVIAFPLAKMYGLIGVALATTVASTLTVLLLFSLLSNKHLYKNLIVFFGKVIGTASFSAFIAYLINLKLKILLLPVISFIGSAGFGVLLYLFISTKLFPDYLSLIKRRGRSDSAS